jgi:hypothetical protein
MRLRDMKYIGINIKGTINKIAIISIYFFILFFSHFEFRMETKSSTSEYFVKEIVVSDQKQRYFTWSKYFGPSWRFSGCNGSNR